MVQVKGKRPYGSQDKKSEANIYLFLKLTDTGRKGLIRNRFAINAHNSSDLIRPANHSK